MGRLTWVEQALPGAEADFIGQLGFIEVQVGLPQGEPGGMVLGVDGAQGNAGHGLFLHSWRMCAASWLSS